MEPLDLVILGTSCSAPTTKRNLYSAVVQFSGMHVLFDCAEGTQQQLMKGKVSYMKIKHVFLSHFHADHVLGLPGLLATMNMYEREEELNIYGPKGVKERVRKMLEIAMAKLEFKINFHELKKGVVLEEEKFEVSAFPLNHRSKCFGFVFCEKDKEGKFNRKKAEKLGIPVGPLYSKLQQGESVTVNGKKFFTKDVMDYSKGRKGRSVAFIVDTLPVAGLEKEIAGVDVLVHEAAFTEELRKRALETKHSTAGDAGKLARKGKVGRLILTHLSSRYINTKPLLEEAGKEFKKVEIAKDLMKVKI